MPGTRHQVLDCRTRRVHPSRFAPPILLSEDAFREQIPGTPPPGVEVFCVVSPLPFIGVPALAELIQPLSVRAFDVINRAFKPLGQNARIIAETDPDMESRAFASEGLETVLERLEPHKRVVVLSGDVHFASGQMISYWKNQSGALSRFIQFTCSDLRPPAEAVTADKELGELAGRAEAIATALATAHSHLEALLAVGQAVDLAVLRQAPLDLSHLGLPAAVPRSTVGSTPADRGALRAQGAEVSATGRGAFNISRFGDNDRFTGE